MKRATLEILEPGEKIFGSPTGGDILFKSLKMMCLEVDHFLKPLKKLNNIC